ncbi:MAG: hypothetical protein PF904_16850 [Kiritimatiellae bacterium]|nr:hypothetical protein [Kiritimatiellia bacterium]
MVFVVGITIGIELNPMVAVSDSDTDTDTDSDCDCDCDCDSDSDDSPINNVHKKQETE